MRLAGEIVAVVAALQGSAFGQAPPRPGGAPVGSEPSDGSNIRWSAGLLIAHPQGDLADEADTSLGIRADVGYNINANLSVHGGLRYVFVNAETDREEALDSFRYYDLGASGRYAFDLTGSALRPFVELKLLYAILSVERARSDVNADDPGIGGRAGVTYPLRPSIDIVFALGYTNIFVGEEGFTNHDYTAAWFDLDGGIQGYF